MGRECPTCDIEISTKVCRDCGEEKPITEFYCRKDGTNYHAPDCKPCSITKTLQWRADNPEKSKVYERRRKREYTEKRKKGNWKSHLRRKYGITQAEYDRMYREQGGVCAICGQSQKTSISKNLFVDHDHKTGRVRALLCTNCNTAIGLMSDDPAIAYNATQYLFEYEQLLEQEGQDDVREAV
jgi:hypothetical protein